MKYVESLNEALHSLIMQDDRIMVIGEDLLDPYGGSFKVTKGLSTEYPDNIISTPISEAGFTGLAIGMALSGYKPIVEIMFGDFLTLVADQIINGVVKFNWMYGENLIGTFVIRTPMGGYRGYGPTHSQSLETIMFSIPGISVVAPSILHDPGLLLKKSVQLKSPVLFVENKMSYPKELVEVHDIFHINHSNDEFPMAEVRIIGEEAARSDITIIAYGGMVEIAMELAYDLFMNEEIITEIFAPSLISPFDVNCIINSLTSNRLIVIEEGYKNSGWGSEIIAQFAEEGYSFDVIQRFASQNYPIPASKSLESLVLPSASHMYPKIIELLRKS